MSGDQGPDIQGFLEELPHQFEQAWRHIYSSSLNLLENWSSRLEDTLNLHTILCHRSEEVHGPVDIIDSLYGLKHDCFSSMTIFSSLSEIMALNLSISLLFSSCAGES